jgi:hypothetical protein
MNNPKQKEKRKKKNKIRGRRKTSALLVCLCPDGRNLKGMVPVLPLIHDMIYCKKERRARTKCRL